MVDQGRAQPIRLGEPAARTVLAALELAQ